MQTALTGKFPVASRPALTDEAAAAWRFTILSALLASAFAPDVADMARLWISSSLYHHGALVAPIAVMLARRSGICAAPRADARGLVAIALALLLLIVARAGTIAILGHLAAVVAIIGAVIASYGLVNARRWAFPLAFLFFMVPFGDSLTPALQEAASVVVAAMLNAVGIDTARSGFMLTTSAGRFEMAESCAGLRFLLASAMISSLAAHLAFRSVRRQAAFLAAALVAALIANWLRAFIVVTLATLTERKLGVGLDHVALGWLIYAALIAALILYAGKVADADDRPRTPAAAAAANGGTAPLLAGAGALTLAAALYLQMVVNNPAISVAAAPVPAIGAAGWRAFPSADAWRAHAPHSDATQTLHYSNGAASVIVAQAVFTHDRPGAEIASFEVRAADGENWRRIAAGRMNVEIAGAQKIVAVETLENLQGARVIVAAAYRVGGRLFASPTSAKLAIVARKLAGARTDGGAIFIAAPVGGEAEIAAFFAAMEPVANWRGRALARRAQKWEPVLRENARQKNDLIIGRDSEITPDDLGAAKG